MLHEEVQDCVGLHLQAVVSEIVEDEDGGGVLVRTEGGAAWHAGWVVVTVSLVVFPL